MEGQFAGAVVGAPTMETTTVRSGARSMATATSGAYWQLTNVVTALDRTYFIRMYLRITGNPSGQLEILAQRLANISCGLITLETSGVLRLRDANGTQVGSDSAALSANTWYCLEMEIMVPTASNGTLRARLDGTEFAGSTSVDVNNSIAANVNTRFIPNAGGGITCYVDDIAINDNTGTSQNTYPGPGKIVLLKPISDNALGSGWMGPQTTGSDTTNLFDNVDNVPPLGVAHADTDANANKYVFNATSTAVANFDMNLQTYTTGGLAASDRVTVAQAIVNTGSSSATDTAGGLMAVSNPADSGETSLAAFDNGIAGTFPTNWLTTRGALVYDPTVALGTSPVVRIGKRTATTRVAMVDLLGLYVEYAPQVIPDFNAGIWIPERR
jgi:hypothetical protein